MFPATKAPNDRTRTPRSGSAWLGLEEPIDAPVLEVPGRVAQLAYVHLLVVLSQTGRRSPVVEQRRDRDERGTGEGHRLGAGRRRRNEETARPRAADRPRTEPASASTHTAGRLPVRPRTNSRALRWASRSAMMPVNRSNSWTRMTPVAVDGIRQDVGTTEQIHEDVPLVIGVGADVQQSVPALPYAARRGPEVGGPGLDLPGQAVLLGAQLVEQADLVHREVDHLRPQIRAGRAASPGRGRRPRCRPRRRTPGRAWPAAALRGDRQGACTRSGRTR